MNDAERGKPAIGVVLVTYNAAEFIGDCLESVVASGYPNIRIVVVDNGSADNTLDVVRGWASGSWAPRHDWPFSADHRRAGPLSFTEYGPDMTHDVSRHDVTLIRTEANLGFAGGVNVGLRALLADPAVELFWVLNPDTVVDPHAPAAFARRAAEMGRFSVIGGRVVFFENPDRVQIDGGRLHKLAGSVVALNVNASVQTPVPPEESLDFISGASMVASRPFIERAGLLDERYFLYFEEVDWQLRRGDLPLGIAKDARILHHAGASIGSAGMSLKPSPFALWFTSRNLMKFVARWQPLKLPIAYLVCYLKLLRHSDGTRLQAEAMLRGLHGLPPPRAVRQRMAESVWERIL